jgi:hypothetical protein
VASACANGSNGFGTDMMSIWSDPLNDESWPYVPSRFGELVFID